MDSRWADAFYDRRKRSMVLVLILSATFLVYYWSELVGSQHLSTAVLSLPSSSFTPGKKVAAIIENRESDNLVPLILHFHSVLGPGWPIILFTSLSDTNFTKSAPFKDRLDAGDFQIKALPMDIEFTSHKAVSLFLTRPWFWEQLAPADHVLLFQSDSIICANAPQHVDDYLQYDMIGAPIAFGNGQGYNGGLSLRNRKKMLDIVKKHSFEEAWEAAQRRKAEQDESARLRKEQIEAEEREKAKQKELENASNGTEATQPEEKLDRREEQKPPSHTWVFPDNPTPPWEDYEDQWFFKRLTELPKKWNGRHGANLPGMDIAKTFSVETVDYDKPLGYHQVGLMIKDKMDQVAKWCPEYRLCTDKRFQNAQ